MNELSGASQADARSLLRAAIFLIARAIKDKVFAVSLSPIITHTPLFLTLPILPWVPTGVARGGGINSTH